MLKWEEWGEEQKFKMGRHVGIFRGGFSHNPVLSMGIQELARGQMPKYFICLGNHLGNYSE